MAPENNKNKDSRRRSIFKIIGLVIYLTIFFYLFYLLINFGLNPLMVSLMLVFILLITITPFLRRNKKGLYSRMFSRAKKEPNSNKSRRKEVEDLYKSEPKIPEPINLDFEYRKPLIEKCKNCGNIVPNFVKKCPFCNETIKHS